MPPFFRRWTPITSVALLLCLLSLVDLWDFGESVAGMDFYAAWTMAQNAGRTDLPNPYARSSQDQMAQEMALRLELAGRPPRLEAAVEAANPLHLTATPFLYTVFRPVSQGTFERDFRLYRFFCFAALLTALGGLARLLGYAPAGILIWLSLLGHYYQPLRSDFRVGNVNQLQLLGLVGYLAILAWAYRRRSDSPSDLPFGVAGLVLAGLVAFKPTLIYVVPVILVAWWLRGQTRAVIAQCLGMATGGLVAVLVACLNFKSWTIWQQWLDSVLHTPFTALPVGYGNFAPAVWLGELLGRDIGTLALIVLLATVFTMQWLTRADPRDPWILDVHWVCLGSLIFLATAPLVWQHYFVAALPLFLVLLRPGMPTGIQTLSTLAAFILLAVDPIAKGFGITDPIRQAPFVHLGLLVLIVTTFGSVWVGEQNPIRETQTEDPDRVE